MATRSVLERFISSSAPEEPASTGRHSSSFLRHHLAEGEPVRRLISVTHAGAFLLAACAALLLGSTPSAHAGKREATLPWTVSVSVHWGQTKNREAYRAGFEHALVSALLEKGCFREVKVKDGSDLVLDVQLEEFLTEQEYSSTETIIPGQGEDHQLRSARAKVKLDYSLRPPADDVKEILGGHFFREARREPYSPTDPTEVRALNDLTLDAARWVVKEVCEHPQRLSEKIVHALPTSRPEAPPAPR